MVLAHKGKIEAFARSLVCEYPALDVDDVIGEAWVCALESKQKWNPKGGASFSSFLHRRLYWLKLDLIDRYLKRKRMETRAWQESEKETFMDPGDLPIREAARRMTAKERELLGLLVCPPVEFVQRECSQGSRIQHRTYARQLDCDEQTVRWYASRIKHLLSEVL